MNAKAYFLQETEEQKVFLRTYLADDEQHPKCSVGAYHDARILIGVRPILKNLRGYIEPLSDADFPAENWPKQCACGFVFPEAAVRQVFQRPLYRRSDTGEILTLDEAPPGALWNAWWMRGCGVEGPDGRCLVAKCPGGGEWMIDGRASNCDSPCKNCGAPYHAHNKEHACKHYKDARPHKCWIRHGEPPVLTVDKNGVTCGAGAGSIIAGGWHGFLINGEFRSC